MERFHSIRRSGATVIATYRDDPMATKPVTVEMSKTDFDERCDRTITQLRRDLSEWEAAKAAARRLCETDFRQA